MYRLANYRCERCGESDVEIHAHHTTYDHLGDERINEILVLCGPCHRLIHADRLDAEVAKHRAGQRASRAPIIGSLECMGGGMMADALREIARSW